MRMADIRRSSASSLADSDDSYEPPRTSGPHVTLKGTNSGVAGCSNLSLSKASAQNCREAVRTGAASEIWIFGFGSLVWKPGKHVFSSGPILASLACSEPPRIAQV